MRRVVVTSTRRFSLGANGMSKAIECVGVLLYVYLK